MQFVYAQNVSGRLVMGCTERTSFCAIAALRRKALVTATAVSLPVAREPTNVSAGLSVMVTSSGVRYSRGMSITRLGRVSGKVGSGDLVCEMDSSRAAWTSRAFSCQHCVFCAVAILQALVDMEEGGTRPGRWKSKGSGKQT